MKNLLKANRNNNAQMMILEVVLLAVMVFLALIFIYQLSPSSTTIDQYSNDLKIWGDNALYSIYHSPPPSSVNTIPGYPKSGMIHYLISNDYRGFIDDINSMLPTTVIYNIYISNESKTVFWCNSFGDFTDPLPAVDPVTVSHYFISIDYNHFTEFPFDSYIYIITDTMTLTDPESDLASEFNGYDGSTYIVILEMWYK